jgi:general secretion pathway protein L
LGCGRLDVQADSKSGKELGVEYGLTRVRQLTPVFFSWWISELKALLPERLMRWVSSSANELALELTGQRLMLLRGNGGSERQLGSIEIGDNLELARSALRPLIADLDLDRILVSLRLPSNLALRKILDLPAAAEENLRQVLAFEMDRLTPFAAEAVHYDVHVIERDVENRRIRAELMVLPRTAVEPSLQLLQRIGLKPDVVALPRGLHERVPWRLPLASNGASGRRRIVYRLPTALLAIAALLLAAGVYVAFNKQRAQIGALEREVAGARKEAEESRRLQEEIQQLSREGTFIIDQKQARPPIVQVLAELTHTLPDDTWLYRLRLMNQELQTFGYSPNASAMIGHIENSSLFSNAQFRAPLTRDQRVDAEQFHIAFQVAPEHAP